jgi:hypothetical protein
MSARTRCLATGYPCADALCQLRKRRANPADMRGFPTNHGSKLSQPPRVATASDRLRTEAQFAAIAEAVLRKGGAIIQTFGCQAQPPYAKAACAASGLTGRSIRIGETQMSALRLCNTAGLLSHPGSRHSAKPGTDSL